MNEASRNSSSVPITALHFLNEEYLISGEGSSVKIYSTNSSCCILCKRIFRDSRVHKFKVISRNLDATESLVLALGGKVAILINIVLLSRETLRIDFKSGEKCFGTWIWDAIKVDDVNNKSCHKGNNKCVALISSENKVLLWNWSNDEVHAISRCVEQCILYCATFWQDSSSNVVVAVGTVFNEVLLWKPFHCHEEASTKFIEKRLKGHEGVIFSVVFTSKGDQLLSVSDDRTIRRWNIEQEECLQILYGHKARVWDVVFLGDVIISIGEDATCVVWDKDSSIIKKFKGHKGKNIWSLAVNEPSMKIATGGGDGSLRLWSLVDSYLSKSIHCTNVNLPEWQHDNDFPRNIRILSLRELLVLTNNGSLLLYSSNSNDEACDMQWRLLFQDEAYSNYSCFEVDRQNRLAIVGGLHGNIKAISLDDYTVEALKAFDGKVFSIFILSVNSSKKVDNETFVAACGPNGIISLWNLQKDEGTLQFTEKKLFELAYCRQRWAVACKILNISSASSQEESYADMASSGYKRSFIVGDRRGSIHVFDATRCANFEPEPRKAIQSFISAHGKTGVTNLQTKQDYIYSTGRDGYFRKFRITEDGTLEALERKKVCKGMDWIEGLLFTDEDIFVYGFYMQSSFAIWSLRRNEVILKINCGGGYRSWDLLLSSVAMEKSLFIYLKGPTVTFCEIPSYSQNHRIIKEGFHGRELTCLQTLGQIQDGESTKVLIATGSEDTLVNIISYNVGSKELELINSLDGHIGSVRSVAIISENECIYQSAKEDHQCNTKSQSKIITTLNYDVPYLLFSCGSRTSLKCSKLCFHDDGHVNVSLLAEIGTPINSIKSKTKNSDWSRSDDVRFLSLQVFSVPKSENAASQCPSCCIAVACSDGHLRLYVYSVFNKTFKLLMATNLHSRCVQVVRHFVCRVGSQDRHFLLSGATDGRIALWDISDCVERASKENGIKFGCKKSEERSKDTENPEEHSRDGVMEDEYDSSDDENMDLFLNVAKICESYFLSDQLNSSVPVCNQSHEPLYIFNAHQSGIHSIDVITGFQDSSIIFASGGDDNSLFTSKFQFLLEAGKLCCHVIWTDENVYAHHSTITGVQLIGPMVLASCSVDQRLKIWSFDHSDATSHSKWKNCMTEFTDIADVSDLNIFCHQDKIYAAICGVGLQLKEIQKFSLKQT